MTATREASQPRMKASPFQTPRSVARMRMNATSVIGSSVMASPMITRSRTTRAPSPAARSARPPGFR